MQFNINFAALALGLLAIANSAFAVGPTLVNLRTAGNYAILAETGISTVPPSSITGDIGVSPGSFTGFSPTPDPSGTFSTSSQVTGKLFAASYKSPTPSQLITAVLDMQTAFNDASGRVNPNFVNLSSGNIGGLTLAPGLYKWSSSVNAASGFTIAGGATDTWIFQIPGTFGLANGVQTTLLGGANALNIVWVVSGDVTLGVGSHFEGVILGKGSITLQTRASVNGRLLAQIHVALQSATVVA
ncbi:antifreeze protein [Phlegmacium glaucopus]|nr:antifreeze protein [Phlegmacium glaucopus]